MQDPHIEMDRISTHLRVNDLALFPMSAIFSGFWLSTYDTVSVLNYTRNLTLQYLVARKPHLISRAVVLSQLRWITPLGFIHTWQQCNHHFTLKGYCLVT